MARISTDLQKSQSDMLTNVSTENRTLREVLHNSKRIGGNYGSLAQSKLQPTFYILHKVNSDDTLQRLALRYGINIQEIKRVNKLWSDPELFLFEHIYIPVDSMQLSALRTKYPTLDFLQSLPIVKDNHRKSSVNTSATDRTTASNQSLDKLNIMTQTNSSSVQDYLSKIDQQIKLTKTTLQSKDGTVNHHPSSGSDELSVEQISLHDSTNSGKNSKMITCNYERHASTNQISEDNPVFNLTKQNSREKYKSLALERIQREKDNFDDL